MTDLLTTPEDIERRIRAVGMSVAEFCRRVPMHVSTFQRWKNNKAPTLPLYRRACAAMLEIEHRSAVEAVERRDPTRVPQDAAE